MKQKRNKLAKWRRKQERKLLREQRNKRRLDCVAAFGGTLVEDAAPAPKAASTPSWSGTVWKKGCIHDAIAPVFDFGGIRIYGTTAMYARSIRDNEALFINCSDKVANDDTLYVPHGFEALRAYEMARRVISIPWPDGCMPIIEPAFWPALAKMLKPGDVYCYCVGSHGRTGVALACLRMQFQPFITAQRAIEEVRKLHCKEAIETQAQIDYVYRVAVLTGGLDMIEDIGERPKGAWSYGSYYSSSQPSGYVAKTTANGVEYENMTPKKQLVLDMLKAPGPGGPTLDGYGEDDGVVYDLEEEDSAFLQSWASMSGYTESDLEPEETD